MKVCPEMFDVVCAGCGLGLGISESKTPLRNKVFHDVDCLDKVPQRPNALRDWEITLLREQGRSVASIAKDYGLSRQRVHSILKAHTETA